MSTTPGLLRENALTRLRRHGSLKSVITLAHAIDGTRASGRKVHVLAAGAVCSNALGNCLLRVGLNTVGPIVSLSPLDYVKAFANVWVVLGVLVLAGWFVLQLSLLSCADLTYVLPVTAASYVLVVLAGAFLLHERVSLTHWCGVFLILAGVAIVGRTTPLTRHGAHR